MSFCPNCSALLKEPTANSCWNCSADFGHGSVWAPVADPPGEIRLRKQTSRTGSDNSDVKTSNETPVWMKVLAILAGPPVAYLVVLSALYAWYEASLNGGNTGGVIFGGSLVLLLTEPSARFVGDDTVNRLAQEFFVLADGPSMEQNALMRVRILLGVLGTFLAGLSCVIFLVSHSMWRRRG